MQKRVTILTTFEIGTMAWKLLLVLAACSLTALAHLDDDFAEFDDEEGEFDFDMPG